LPRTESAKGSQILLAADVGTVIHAGRMTHLIARTQVPGADEHERLSALDALASLGFSA